VRKAAWTPNEDTEGVDNRRLEEEERADFTEAVADLEDWELTIEDAKRETWREIGDMVGIMKEMSRQDVKSNQTQVPLFGLEEDEDQLANVGGDFRWALE